MHLCLSLRRFAQHFYARLRHVQCRHLEGSFRHAGGIAQIVEQLFHSGSRTRTHGDADRLKLIRPSPVEFGPAGAHKNSKSGVVEPRHQVFEAGFGLGCGGVHLAWGIEI